MVDNSGMIYLVHTSYYPCGKQEYCNRVLDIFPVNNFPQNGRFKYQW